MIDYHTEQATYHIEIKNPDRLSCGVSYIAVDGEFCPDGGIILAQSGFHRVDVVMGTPFVSPQEAESISDTESITDPELYVT